ncbi:ABC transporter substrate-binding protein [Corynebacterium cystitidis]|uniref:ABC transporter substrate-binding protein n=1 Tax=Corynebacterium cystitidis TaxID=35757 RepID=UPI00211E5344|nr:ABC transporter substrate-binding protein [Corynebacterium cystitidis]
MTCTPVSTRHADRRNLMALATLTVASVMLTACANEDPLTADTDTNVAVDETITIGTANFPESEIIGQIWAEALREAGFEVEVTSGIGSREVYLSALENGEVDIVPEYTGNLSQFYGAEIEQGAGAETVYAAVESSLPDGLRAGEYAPAESKDAFMVTPQVAEQYDLVTLYDLAKINDIVLAGNPELAERPYGPKGLAEVYNVPAESITMNPISDGGGPLTVAALLQGEATVADIYTTSPHLDSNGNEVDLVQLEDPENMVLPQNVLPVHSADSVPEEALDAIATINRDLTTEDLTEMNLRNVGSEKAEPASIAKDYIAEQ